MFVVVVASSRDRLAAQLAARWGARRSRLLTSRDLSRAGWRYQPGAVDGSHAVIGGARVRASDIDGVLVRLPYVGVEDVPHIEPADRSYVAQEMTAFLTAWLTELPCPVVNRPTAACLGGPGWSRERWRHLASTLGLELRVGARTWTTVTIVGERGFGSTMAVDRARMLADAAGMNLLDVHFDDGLRFVGVDPWPDVSRPEVAQALLDTLRRP